jgi:N utilization substance protein B
LYAHFNAADTGMVKPEKELDFSIKKTYDLYYYLLVLAVAVKKYAQSRIDLARNKKLPTYEDLHPNMRFTEHRLIMQIAGDKQFNEYLNREKLSWVNYPELVKTMYQRLKESSYYADYMTAPEASYENDKNLLINFYTRETGDNELFLQIIEENSIFWNDDVDFVLPMVVKTIKSMEENHPVKLLPLYKSEDDREFAHVLLRQSILHYEEYLQRIMRRTENWDIERIAMIDKIIMVMAINEFIEFPSIPLRVTFDEYLEMSKYYSTPKSSIFVNGVLDKISSELFAEGKIIKTGRGLVGWETETEVETETEHGDEVKA